MLPANPTKPGRIHIREKVVELSGVLTRETKLKTNAGLRTVPIPANLAAILRDHLTQRPPGSADTVFPTQTGKVIRPNNWRSRRWRPAVKRAGQAPLHIHTLRHTAISRWIAEGANELEVTRWAGHSSVKVTHDVYGHLFDTVNLVVMGRLDNHIQAGDMTPDPASTPHDDAKVIDFAARKGTETA